jgi:hypothetical protein
MSQYLVVRHTFSTARNTLFDEWTRVINTLGNIGLRHHAGIEMRFFLERAYVPAKATIADQIRSGNSVMTADWTICLDHVKKGIANQPREPVLTPRLVISFGFQADGREQLVRDAKLWLETWPTVARAVVVTIVEEPQYSCPIPFEFLEHADLPTRDAFEDFLYPQGKRKLLQPVTGPIHFRGHRWTGTFSHVSSETWMRRETPSGFQVVLEEGSKQVCGEASTLLLNIKSHRSYYSFTPGPETQQLSDTVGLLWNRIYLPRMTSALVSLLCKLSPARSSAWTRAKRGIC